MIRETCMDRIEYRRIDLRCERCQAVIGAGLVLKTLTPWLWLRCLLCAAEQSVEEKEVMKE